MPVFYVIRLKLKFRHRLFQKFWNFEKIFTELGDTAHQSWKDSGKSPDPRQLATREVPKSVQIHWFRNIQSAEVKPAFVTRDLGAECELGLHIWSAWSYVQNLVSNFLFFENFDFKKYFHGFFIREATLRSTKLNPTGIPYQKGTKMTWNFRQPKT